MDGKLIRKDNKGACWKEYVGQIMKDVKAQCYAGIKRLAFRRVD
jgi:hypothetical protein